MKLYRPIEHVEIDCEKVPKFLKNSQLYQEIKVPKEYYVKDLDITDDKKYQKVLNALRYWNVNKLPDELIEYAKNNVVTLDYDKHYLNFKLLDPLRDIQKILNEKNLCLAIRKDYKEMAEFIYKELAKDVKRMFYDETYAAIKHNKVWWLEFFHKNEYLPRKNIYLSANMQWKKYYKTTAFLTNSAGHGRLECLKFFVENNYPWSKGPYRGPSKPAHEAARHGHLECLKYIHTKCSIPTNPDFENQWCDWVTVEAAMGGHLDCIKFFFDNVTSRYHNWCIWSAYAVEYAIEYKNYDCIEYVMSKCPDPKKLASNCYYFYEKCAKYNDLKAMKIVCEAYKKYPNNLRYVSWEQACKIIAQNGNIEMLKYAYENGANLNGYENIFIKCGIFEKRK